MEYLLVNCHERAQNQCFAHVFSEIVCEAYGRIAHDMEILNSYGITDFNPLYNGYIIYKVRRAPRTQLISIVETYKYNTSTSQFEMVTMPDVAKQEQPKPVTSNAVTVPAVPATTATATAVPTVPSDVMAHVDKLLNKEMENIKLFDIQCKRKQPSTPKHIVKTPECSDDDEETYASDIDELDDLEDDEDGELDEVDDAEDEELVASDEEDASDAETDVNDILKNSDDDEIDENDAEIKAVKEKMIQLKKLQAIKAAQIKQIEETHKQSQEEIADALCEISLAKKKEAFEKNKLEEQIRKFEADRVVYKKIKLDMAGDNIDESKIPSFFINVYRILKELDTTNEIDAPDAFNKFMELYKSALDKQKDTLKEEDENYGIFN